MAIGCLAVLSACASGDISRAPSEAGVEAYRAKDYQTAWTLLQPLAARGHFRAQRYLAFMLIEGNAPVACDAGGCGAQAVELLSDAASRGDNNALIVLEAMRASDPPYAPDDEAIIAIETKRARRGDAMTAWRLAKRYREGDGVAVSEVEALKWLKVAGKGNASLYPYADDAAFMVCEAYASGAGIKRNVRAAKKWCRRAAKNGHSGAVIALGRLD